MRSIIIAAILLFLSMNCANAQFRIGAIGGGGVSRFVFEDQDYKEAFSSGFRPGYQLGVMLNYKVSKLYSLQTEMSFVKKGINVRNRGGMIDVTNKASFYYLSVPALLRFSTHKFIGNQHVEVYLNIGPEVNYWLGGHGLLSTSEPVPGVEEGAISYKVRFTANDSGFGRYMVVEEPSRIQMALAGGGGLIFDLGQNQHFAIDLRSSLGLGKSFHGPQEGGDYGLQLYSENLEAVHHTFTVTASWFINIDLNTVLRKGRVSFAE